MNASDENYAAMLETKINNLSLLPKQLDKKLEEMNKDMMTRTSMVGDIQKAQYQQERTITLNAKAHQEGIDHVTTAIKVLQNDLFKLNDKINKERVAYEGTIIKLDRRDEYADKRIRELELVARLVRIHETEKADTIEFDKLRERVMNRTPNLEQFNERS